MMGTVKLVRLFCTKMRRHIAESDSEYVLLTITITWGTSMSQQHLQFHSNLNPEQIYICSKFNNT